MRALAALGLAFALAACGGGAYRASVAPQDGYAQSAPAEEAYRLGVADEVRVTVFDEPDLSGTFTLNPDGTLAYPLLGDVPAAGLSTAELGVELENRLRAGYVRQPRVSVEVAAFRPIFVLGEVARPGGYPFEANMTVLTAVARAGGFGVRAERRRVFIRQGSGPEQLYYLDADTPVRPGDTVRIPERYF